MKSILIIIFTATCLIASAQKNSTLPYYELPSSPENFTAGGVASRMIDGLGFRYYWATDSLRKEDLVYKPGEAARTSEETVNHIHALSMIIANATAKTPNIPQENKPVLTFETMRKQTLENLKSASDRLRTATDTEMNDFRIVFKRDSGTKEFPFWNNINGPIADALWHVGQLVSFRRSSGNPFTDKVNVFTGTVSK